MTVTRDVTRRRILTVDPEKLREADAFGLYVARMVGFSVGLFLMLAAFVQLVDPPRPMTDWLVAKQTFFACFGALLTLPWYKIARRPIWRPMFIATILSSLLFIIATMLAVLFEYVWMMESGIEPGLPAFEGTLIFLTFMQVPVIYFIRHPEAMR